MALRRQTCVNHPDRLAIGLCVKTKQTICAECSTRYEGVNYSKEGLRILQQERAAGQSAAQRGRLAVMLLCAGGSPLFLLLLYLFYRLALTSLIDMQQLHIGAFAVER